jgi:DNA-directed RNA polymerase specialized sigma24 family protein
MDEHPDAVTCWIGGLQRGCPDAQRRIFDRYFGSATRLAERKLGATRRREADEEDVALSAMQSFFRGVAADQFARLGSRDDLWALIAVITARKAIGQTRRLMARKRGAARERGESVFDGGVEGLASAAAGGVDHEREADARDLGRWLLEQLPDPLLRSIALLRLEGLSTEEIAAAMNVVPRTVERKLARIRDLWIAAGEDGP